MILTFLYRLFFSKPSALSLFEVISVKRRVKLRDIDSNIHLTNSRYLYYLDLSRVECMFQTGLFKGFMEAEIRPVVSAVDITFIKEIKPFKKFTVQSQVLGWDDKYLYFQQNFKVENALHASALSRICPLVDGKKISPEEMLKKCDIKEQAPELPTSVLAWKESLSTRAALNKS